MFGLKIWQVTLYKRQNLQSTGKKGIKAARLATSRDYFLQMVLSGDKKLNDNQTSHYGLHLLPLIFSEDENKFAGIFAVKWSLIQVLQKNWGAACLGLCYENEYSVRSSKKYAYILGNNFFRLSTKPQINFFKN